MGHHSRRVSSYKTILLRGTGVAALALLPLAGPTAAAAPPAPMNLVRAGLSASEARLMADIQQSPTGAVLANRLEVLAWDAPLKSFPSGAPAPGVIVDYLKSSFPADLDSRPYWRAHRGNWRGAMRSTILAALYRPLDDRQLRHAVAVMPLFLESGDLAATTQSLRQAIALDAALAGHDDFSAEVFRRGLRRWITAMWNRGNDARAQVVLALADGIRPRAAEPAIATQLARWNEWIPVTGWLVRHPDQLQRALADRDRPVRQQLLALLLKSESSDKIESVIAQLDPALIEALQGDNALPSQETALKLLAPRARALQPLLHQAFLASADWRQKTALAELLVSTDERAVREDLLLFGYRLLASVPVENFPRENDCCWPGQAGQVIWASGMLERIGDPAREFVADRLQDTIDPRQAALGLLVLAKDNQVPDRVWDERLMRLLVFGMDANAPETQRELCTASLKFAPAAVQERIRQIAAEPSNATQLVVRDAVRSRAEDHITAYNTLLREPQ